MDEWVTAVSDYINHGLTPEHITAHIATTTDKPLKEYRKQAKELVTARGSVKRVLRKMRRDAKRGRVQQ
jgi:hypothetical protein